MRAQTRRPGTNGSSSSRSTNVGTGKASTATLSKIVSCPPSIVTSWTVMLARPVWGSEMRNSVPQKVVFREKSTSSTSSLESTSMA